MRILNRTLAKLGESPRELDEFVGGGDWQGGIDREIDAANNRLTRAEAAKHFEAGRQQQRDQSIEPEERDLAARLEAYENARARADKLAVRLVPSGQAGPKMVRDTGKERVRKQISDKSQVHHGHAGLDTKAKRKSKARVKPESGYWDLATGRFVPCVKKEGENRNNNNLNAQKMAWRLSPAFKEAEKTLKTYKIKFGLGKHDL